MVITSNKLVKLPGICKHTRPISDSFVLMGLFDVRCTRKNVAWTFPT